MFSCMSFQRGPFWTIFKCTSYKVNFFFPPHFRPFHLGLFWTKLENLSYKVRLTFSALLTSISDIRKWRYISGGTKRFFYVRVPFSSLEGTFSYKEYCKSCSGQNTGGETTYGQHKNVWKEMEERKKGVKGKKCNRDIFIKEEKGLSLRKCRLKFTSHANAYERLTCQLLLLKLSNIKGDRVIFPGLYSVSRS